MEEIGSFWSYPESIDELKQKLFYTTLELQSVKVEAKEEMRKNKENVKQLFELVKIACQERDEARDQLQTLLNKLISSTPSTEFFPNPPHETHLLKPVKANSSKAESNSLSEPYNYHSHSSSPVDSFFEPGPISGSTPELTNIIGDSVQVGFVGPACNNGTISNNMVYSGVPKIDQDSLIIENLVKGKALPQQGKLLPAVLEAGPLLQTLLVAGPLPQWRNPPPLQAFHIPPVSIKGINNEIVDQKPTVCGTNEQISQSVTHVSKSRPFIEMTCGLNFANGTSGSYMSNGRLVPAGSSMNSYIPNGKRPRFQ
ncbi:hypothetical protein LguiB_031243 [Lonicera macranthoides]